MAEVVAPPQHRIGDIHQTAGFVLTSGQIDRRREFVDLAGKVVRGNPPLQQTATSLQGVALDAVAYFGMARRNGLGGEEHVAQAHWA